MKRPPPPTRPIQFKTSALSFNEGLKEERLAFIQARDKLLTTEWHINCQEAVLARCWDGLFLEWRRMKASSPPASWEVPSCPDNIDACYSKWYPKAPETWLPVPLVPESLQEWLEWRHAVIPLMDLLGDPSGGRKWSGASHRQTLSPYIPAADNMRLIKHFNISCIGSSMLLARQILCFLPPEFSFLNLLCRPPPHPWVLLCSKP